VSRWRRRRCGARRSLRRRDGLSRWQVGDVPSATDAIVVYDGEEAKLYDFNESAPRFIVDDLVRPALAAGRRVVIMGEEWQTAEAMCRVSDLLHGSGLRSRVPLLWNANNCLTCCKLAFTTAAERV
jgi:hypothetical protein